MRVLIITGGNIDDDFAFSFLENKMYDEVIAVDGGLAFVDRMNQRSEPQVSLELTHLVGDFDTIAPEILEKYRYRKDICVHAYVPEKDYTDTDIAIRLAITLLEYAEGEREIHILGATGTRLDHVLANMQMLLQILDKGIRGIIVDKHNMIELICGKYTLKKNPAFKYVSLIPATMRVSEITLNGFKYPLNHAATSFGESLCVSNELIENEGIIEINDGLMWLILSRD